MSTQLGPLLETAEERSAMDRFRAENPELFKKDDSKLFLHLGIVISLIALFTVITVTSHFLWMKLAFGVMNALLWFSLINVTIHHHHTHHNSAASPFSDKLLNILYRIAVPNAPKRRSRYTRAHMNHHARPYDETDVDHHFGKNRYFEMKQDPFKELIYFLDLTFVGSHVPGWEDDQYMNQVPLENWNRADYAKVMQKEKEKAFKIAAIQWGGFILAAWIVPWIAWGWAFPMLLVKNWAHYLGQFQHYDEKFLDPARTINARTKTYRLPSWFNYVMGGEISGHFIHHLFPELPYYNVEAARQKFLADSELTKLFVNY